LALLAAVDADPRLRSDVLCEDDPKEKVGLMLPDRWWLLLLLVVVLLFFLFLPSRNENEVLLFRLWLLPLPPLALRRWPFFPAVVRRGFLL
jgi:hypothetical protein